MEHTKSSATMIEQLYHDHHRSLLRYLYRLVSDPETAEDLAQETFIKAMRAWSGLENADVARNWLYRIATNTAYDHLRRCRRIAITPLTDEHETSMYAPALETQLDDAEPVWAALKHLPEEYRVPLLLQLGAGYTLNDIAAALGCNINTVKSRVHRARIRFREVYVAPVC
jgi:RNA polymerase sigma-70 factor (ECF subfamily)